MGNELVKQEQLHELSAQGVFSTLENFKEIYDIGKMFASSTLVPQAYQGKAMDCTIAVDMANRMGISPMMVMQNLYVVRGKPSWSGQACTALIEGSGKFKNVKHVYTGEKGTDTWGCYLQAVRIEDNEVVKGAEVTIAMAKGEDWYSKKDKYGNETSKWQTMPELMLAYRASAFFARVHIPNALMGVSVEGEVEDIQKPALREVPSIFGSGVIDNDANE
jgi:hypothetical protein